MEILFLQKWDLIYYFLFHLVYVFQYLLQIGLIKKIVSLGLLLSLLYETLQFILAIGISDVTDLLFNTLGVCCGILLYQLINNLFNNRITVLINTIGILFVAIPTIGLLALVILGLK